MCGSSDRHSDADFVLLSASNLPSFSSLSFHPFSQSQHPLSATGPTPRCYWCRWLAAWSSLSSSSALLSSAAGEPPSLRRLLAPLLPAVSPSLLPDKGCLAQAAGEVAVRRRTSLENTHTHTHTRRHARAHARRARQLLQLAHVR